MKPHPSMMVALVLPWALGACSNPAAVTEREPVFQPVRAGVGALVEVQQGIVTALEGRSDEPRATIGNLLSAAHDAADHLASAPGDTAARDAYNFAVSRVFGVLKDAGLDPWSEPQTFPSPRGDIILTHRPDPRPNWNPALYDFTPSDRFELKGSYVKERTIRTGIGAPLVAVGRGLNERVAEDFTIPRIYYGVTAG